MVQTLETTQEESLTPTGAVEPEVASLHQQLRQLLERLLMEISLIGMGATLTEIEDVELQDALRILLVEPLLHFLTVLTKDQ